MPSWISWDKAAQAIDQQRDFRRKLIESDPLAVKYGEERINFGQYQYRSITEIFILDPNYIGWLAEKAIIRNPQFQEAVDWFANTFSNEIRKHGPLHKSRRFQ